VWVDDAAHPRDSIVEGGRDVDDVRAAATSSTPACWAARRSPTLFACAAPTSHSTARPAIVRHSCSRPSDVPTRPTVTRKPPVDAAGPRSLRPTPFPSVVSGDHAGGDDLGSVGGRGAQWTAPLTWPQQTSSIGFDSLVGTYSRLAGTARLGAYYFPPLKHRSCGLPLVRQPPGCRWSRSLPRRLA